MVLLLKFDVAKSFREKMNYLYVNAGYINVIKNLKNTCGIEMYGIAEMKQFLHLNTNSYLLADFCKFQSQLYFRSYKFLAYTEILIFNFLENFYHFIITF